MAVLLESKAELRKDGHIIFRQLIQRDKREDAAWLDIDITRLSPETDKSGFTSESAFLFGIAIANNTTVEEMHTRLEQEGVIYIYPSFDKSNRVLQ